METLLFGIVMLAVAWLVLWSCADHVPPTKTWWPFDFRLSPAKDTSKPPRSPQWGHRQPQRNVRWNRSGS